MKYISLTQGKFAIVDDEDYEYLNQWKWCADKGRNTYYAIRQLWDKNKKIYTKIYMHRQLLCIVSNQITDHINHNGLDNRKFNIRICNYSLNSANQKKTRGASKYKGVSWRKDTKKWKAEIKAYGTKYNLGCFNKENNAALAYNNKATELFGKFAYLNVL